MSDGLSSRPVYAYVITSIQLTDGKFRQHGSAPNFQGGLVTLCTCKHKDRASPPKVNCRGPDPKDPWVGVWIAGLCSVREARPRTLFYLMLVEKTFASHADLWARLPPPTARAKSARLSPFGDVYEPRNSTTGHPWSESSYRPSHRNHVHRTHDRRHDIEAVYYGRRSRLLIGDPDASFLWTSPKLLLTADADAGWRSAHHRFYHCLDHFLLAFK